ncbi:hypothetical protein D3C87_1722840 [compost metagenome]
MSSMMRVSDLPLREMISRYFALSSGSRSSVPMSSANPRMTPNGVRISWDMFAKNADFARLECSAASFAASSAARVLSTDVVVSRIVQSIPEIFPSALNRGEFP